MILEKKVVQKKVSKNNFKKKCTPKLVFLIDEKIWMKIHFDSQILTLCDIPSVDEFTKYSGFIWLQMIFGQKSWYLGPRQIAKAKNKYSLTWMLFF